MKYYKNILIIFILLLFIPIINSCNIKSIPTPSPSPTPTFTPVPVSVALEWNDKGNKLYKEGKYNEAIKCYDKALSIKPKSSIIWCNKGNAYSYLKNYKMAILCYAEAVKIDPNNKEAEENEKIAYKYYDISRYTPTPKEKIVYITETGSHFHRIGCRYLRKNVTPITEKEAISKGYSPCSKCRY